MFVGDGVLVDTGIVFSAGVDVAVSGVDVDEKPHPLNTIINVANNRCLAEVFFIIIKMPYSMGFQCILYLSLRILIDQLLLFML